MAIQLYKNGERISGSGVTINTAGGTAADVVDTVGAETVSDGVDLITVVTRDTDQTITSDKIISGQLTSSGVTVFTTPTAGNATTTVATTAFVDRDFEKVISGSNQVAYATELSGVPTTFAPSAHTHVLADVTDSGALAALNNVDYSGTIITNKPFTHATQAAFESAVDTRITTIGDVVIFANAAAFTADSSSTTWHKGDVAILTDTNVAYLFTGTDGDTTVTLAADFHQITSTETLASLGIMASAADLNQLNGITLGDLAGQDNLTAAQVTALNIPDTQLTQAEVRSFADQAYVRSVQDAPIPNTDTQLTQAEVRAFETPNTTALAATAITTGILPDTVDIGNQNSANGLKFWTGAESAAPSTRDANTFYIFTS